MTISIKQKEKTLITTHTLKCIYCTRKESLKLIVDKTTSVCTECQQQLQVFNFDLLRGIDIFRELVLILYLNYNIKLVDISKILVVNYNTIKTITHRYKKYQEQRKIESIEKFQELINAALNETLKRVKIIKEI